MPKQVVRCLPVEKSLHHCDSHGESESLRVHSQQPSERPT